MSETTPHIISREANILTASHARGKTVFGVSDAIVDAKRWFLIIELEDNKSTSVTNCSEEVIARVLEAAANRDGIQHQPTDRFFEAYEYRMRLDGRVDPKVAEIVYPGGEWHTTISASDAQALLPLFARWIEVNG